MLLIMDDNVPCRHRPLGRALLAFSGKRGVVRSEELTFAPIVKLIWLNLVIGEVARFG